MNPSPERGITTGNADINIKLSGENLLFKILQLPLKPGRINEYKSKLKTER